MKSITKVCPNCRFTTTNNLKFCPKCGAKLVEKAEVHEETLAFLDEHILSEDSTTTTTATTTTTVEKPHEINFSLFRSDFKKSAIFQIIYCITILLSLIAFLFVPMYMLDPMLNFEEAYYSIFDIIKPSTTEFSDINSILLYVIIPITYLIMLIVPIAIKFVGSITNLVGGDDRLKIKYNKIAYDSRTGFVGLRKNEKFKTITELIRAIFTTILIVAVPLIIGYVTENAISIGGAYFDILYLLAGLKNLNLYSIILYLLLIIALASAICSSVFAIRLNTSVKTYIAKKEQSQKK